MPALPAVSFVSFDHLILIGIFGAFLALAFVLGRGKTVALYLSLYVGLLLYAYFPYKETVAGFASTPFSKGLALCALLLALSALAYMVIRQSIDIFSMVESGGVDSFALAALGTGISLAVLHNSVPFGAVYKFPASISAFFTFEHAFFWWLLGGLAVLFVLLRR